MKRTIKYKGIKEIVYVLEECTLNDAVLAAIKESSLFVSSQKPSKWTYEWGDHENNTVYLEVTQKIIQEEKNEDN